MLAFLLVTTNMLNSLQLLQLSTHTKIPLPEQNKQERQRGRAGREKDKTGREWGTKATIANGYIIFKRASRSDSGTIMAMVVV